MKRIDLKQTGIVALGLGMLVLSAPLASAQEAPMPDDPGMADAGGQSSSNANEPGSIDTSQPMPGSTTTTTVTTQTNNGYSDYQVEGDEYSETLSNTGGEPLLFVLAGCTLIAGGWVLRRKMAA